MPGFTLQKVACFRVLLVKKAIMKTQERRTGELNGIRNLFTSRVVRC